MNRRELENRTVDPKLVMLLFVRKISYVIIAAVIGGALCSGIYGLWYEKASGREQYLADSKFYIEFEENLEKDYFDYRYNGYTWNDLISTDLILGKAMNELTEYSRKEVDDCVEGEILSDLRLLTLHVSATTTDQVVRIQEVMNRVILDYVNEEEHITSIKMIRCDEPELVKMDNHFMRVLLVGAVCFAILSVILILLGITVSEGIYLPQEAEERLLLPCAGFLFDEKKNAVAEKLDALCRRNLGALCGEKYEMVAIGEVLDMAGDRMQGLKDKSVVLAVSQGDAENKQALLAAKTLAQQGISAKACVITKASAGLMRAYYRFTGMKED